MPNILTYFIFGMTILLFVLMLCLLAGWRLIVKRMVQQAGKIILTDTYQENIMELIPGFRHMGIQNTLENSLRAETGKVLHRPLGSSKKWPHLESITFIPAQTSPFPVSSEEEIDIEVTIGPKAKKPLRIPIPLMISGMGYGVSLSEQARLSLARAAKNTGTALNSGEGGVLPEELSAAGKYILQFSKTEWGKEEKLIKHADMIEIKLGQGALFGMGTHIPPDDLTGDARKVMGLEKGEMAIIHEHFLRIKH